jgi:FixJ family two-component response regulator
MMRPCIGKHSMQGCVALLHKPFLEHQLIDAIEKAVP